MCSVTLITVSHNMHLNDERKRELLTHNSCTIVTASIQLIIIFSEELNWAAKSCQITSAARSIQIELLGLERLNRVTAKAVSASNFPIGDSTS